VDDFSAAPASVVESAPSSLSANQTTALVQDKEDISFKIQSFEARAAEMGELGSDSCEKQSDQR
jgi:hypothetical protein